MKRNVKVKNEDNLECLSAFQYTIILSPITKLIFDFINFNQRNEYLFMNNKGKHPLTEY